MPFPTYTTKEEVPEAFRDEYEEKEGKWVAKVPDVTKAQSALDAERTRAENEKKERIKAENALADMRRKDAAREGNVSEETLQKLRDEDATKRREELDPLRQERDQLKAENTKIKKTDRVQQMWLDAGGIPERREDAMLSLDKRTGLTEDGNTITVLDKDGKLTTAKVEDFIKVDFKKEKPWLYRGPGGSGSGALQSNGDDPEPTPATANARRLAEQRAVVATAL
jgi:primosomal protein N'